MLFVIMDLLRDVLPRIRSTAMPRDFFDPTPEARIIVLIEGLDLRDAESLIESCEHCNPDNAEIPFRSQWTYNRNTIDVLQRQSPCGSRSHDTTVQPRESTPAGSSFLES